MASSCSKMSIKSPIEAVQQVAEPMSARASVGTWCELFKARLTTLVLLTTAVGYWFANHESALGSGFWLALVGTGLLAAGAAALNQYWERASDALMQRTASRPIPSGAIEPALALAVGVVLSMVGMLELTFLINPLTGLLGMLTLASYVFVYTPLKRRTTLNTLVGAVPGALPPLMGWTAATGEFGTGGWVLFTILFFWQLPHFMAIAWLYREDYARAGFRMLPVEDETGLRTGATAVRHTVALIAFSLAPVALGLAGRWYAAFAVVGGIAFLGCAIVFASHLSRQSARRLFFASILYLPMILGALVADKAKQVTPLATRQTVMASRQRVPFEQASISTPSASSSSPESRTKKPRFEFLNTTP